MGEAGEIAAVPVVPAVAVATKAGAVDVGGASGASAPGRGNQPDRGVEHSSIHYLSGQNDGNVGRPILFRAKVTTM